MLYYDAMSGDREEYVAFLNEVIAKQSVILGPDVAVLKARRITNLEMADDGTVTSISGDPNVVAQELIDTYVKLAGRIIEKTLAPILTKYPNLEKDLQQRKTAE